MSQRSLLAILVIVVVTTAFSKPQDHRPNFSGFWELDKTRSEISSPTSASVVQLIEHREPKLRITRIIRGEYGEEMLELELTTDGTENVNNVDEHQLSFKTRWKGSRLIIEVTPSGQANLVVIEEVWVLSQDSRTLTIELRLHGSKCNIQEKLIYVKKSP